MVGSRQKWTVKKSQSTFRHSFFSKVDTGRRAQAQIPLSFSLNDVFAFASGVRGHGCAYWWGLGLHLLDLLGRSCSFFRGDDDEMRRGCIRKEIDDLLEHA